MHTISASLLLYEHHRNWQGFDQGLCLYAHQACFSNHRCRLLEAMPVERRSLRSSKDTPSTNNSSKEKPSHSRTTSKSKAAPAKKPSSEQPPKGTSEAKPIVNGAELTQNGINGTQDVEMNGESGSGDQMTVVVPPPRDSRTPGQPEKDEAAMDVGEDGANQDDVPQKTYESLFQGQLISNSSYISLTWC